MKRKSQITMLMIVGLVLFIIISLVLYLSKSTVKKTTQQNIRKTQETALEIQPIKQFVNECLDKLTKDAIVLVGKQGGYIYKNQGGPLVDYLDTDEGIFFVKHNNLNVAYNILSSRFAVPPYSSEIPDYPWQTFPYQSEASDEEIFNGYFGINNMPPLNASEGPNSIQTQIEAFVDNNMATCLDFSFFKKQGYDIFVNSTKTSVIIGSGDVSVNSKIPITITNAATKEFAELEDFSTNINIRLRDIYFYTKELIENDVKNIKFNISSINNNKESLNIKVVKNVYNNDDLIIATDEKSLIYGKPFEYIFARKNRAPAFYYLKKTTLDFPHLHTITQEELLSGVTLKAEDPDEDTTTFTISPQLPKVLDVPQLKFKIEVGDGKLLDYQVITVNRI